MKNHKGLIYLCCIKNTNTKEYVKGIDDLNCVVLWSKNYKESLQFKSINDIVNFTLMYRSSIDKIMKEKTLHYCMIFPSCMKYNVEIPLA